MPRNRFSKSAFTLPELLISVAIFASVAVLVSSLYIKSFRMTGSSNLQNQVYEDAWYILKKISEEINSSMIDYDEYYAQNVVGASNFGQEYGKYYSSFYNPGSDGKLGFFCQNGVDRNKKDCKPQRKTLDKNTGQNPFDGKSGGDNPADENAFCGKVNDAASATGELPDTGGSLCPANVGAKTAQHELYLISADAKQKTIIAKERIGGTEKEPIYALSILKMKGEDSNDDDILEFTCAEDFDCLGEGNLPRVRDYELNPGDKSFPDPDDPESTGFAKDFVPITPFRVNVIGFNLYISPAENPNYAFAENGELLQPRVSIVLTIEANPEQVGDVSALEPVTIAQTIESQVLTPIPAQILME